MYQMRLVQKRLFLMMLFLKKERPCAKACRDECDWSDEYGNAHINYDKCVSCGMCLVSCPFGAIADKSQIFQLIQAIKEGDEIIAPLPQLLLDNSELK